MTITTNAARVVAYNWHGGMSSHLYAFASTGCIQSEQHRVGTVCEVEEAIMVSKQRLSITPDDPEYFSEPERLTKLKEYVEKAPISTEYVETDIPEDIWREWSSASYGMDIFTMSYITAALWSSTDADGQPLDRNYCVDDIDPETVEKMKDDCQMFQMFFSRLIDEAKEKKPGYDDDHAGHDFWLTRNRHGVGFWDRGLGEVGEKLTKAAHVFGEVDLYIGDDFKVYQQ